MQSSLSSIRVAKIIDLSFSLYSTFVVEARHGFNKKFEFPSWSVPMSSRPALKLPSVASLRILKDLPSWLSDCRSVDVLNVLPTANGGTIELLYMQVESKYTGHVG
ncbi:hypothetical protein M0R45_008994 [Rubus argutus]|uniref:CAAX prenyl protease 1 N-terminal domain-containing protein n=1 Tax=Rubus argutus TaxID=59490 RepID=A0AAW1Y393_RUBAR